MRLIAATACLSVCTSVGSSHTNRLNGNQQLMPGTSVYRKEIQLTNEPKGHMLNESQCFSKDDSWIVYDGRDLETPIPENTEIAMVHTQTRKVRLLYKTPTASVHGPGVGAVTFSPVDDRVLFIHGVRNCDVAHPYSFSRRTGVAVNIKTPGTIEYLDARNMEAPFTPGALRGGTHAHSWSADGNWISFTYNDDILKQRSLVDSTVQDLRMVAVMNNHRNVVIPNAGNPENNHGAMFAVVVTDVTEHPKPNSDEIDKAFDEGWIGTNGYLRKDGSRQLRAIAFQGNVRDKDNKTHTEVFVVDIADDISVARPAYPIEGTETSRPSVPAGTSQRRITYTRKGITGPRFWLRSTPDGSLIGFLSADDNGIIQAFGVSPNGGVITQLTFNEKSIEGPINFSPDGKQLAYIAGGAVCVTNLGTKQTEMLTAPSSEDALAVGAVVWSNNGRHLAYNRNIRDTSGLHLQIFMIDL